MSNIIKFLLVLAPVSALILYFTLLKSNEVSTRVSLQQTQIQKNIDQFNEEFANFDNKTFWQKESQHYAEKKQLEQEIQHLKKQLSQLRQQEMKDLKTYEETLKNADNSTHFKNIKDLRVP